MKTKQTIRRVLPAVFLLCLGCVGTAGQAEQPHMEPAWWLHRTAGGDPGKLVGYGCGPTLEFARTAALGEIAEQVAVHVRSETLLAKSCDSESSSETFNDAIQSSSRVTLGATTILKEEARGGYFYTALQYGNAP